jgi:ubiquinone/menaquinone biosynthesis C-methylase UbiE
MADKETEKYYNQRAPEYEQIYFRDDVARRKEIADESERLGRLATGRRVLELACGTGYWTEVMSATAVSIDAVDLSPEMLAVAQKKTYRCPVTFTQSDMQAYAAAAGAYDLVALGFWFSHQPRQEYQAFFDLIGRPLKPGGTIWMIDNNPPAEGPLSHHARVDTHGNNYKYRFLDNGEQYTILKNYFERAGLQNLFSPRFTVESLIHQRYYWSVVLTPKS